MFWLVMTDEISMFRRNYCCLLPIGHVKLQLNSYFISSSAIYRSANYLAASATAVAQLWWINEQISYILNRSISHFDSVPMRFNFGMCDCKAFRRSFTFEIFGAATMLHESHFVRAAQSECHFEQKSSEKERKEKKKNSEMKFRNICYQFYLNYFRTQYLSEPKKGKKKRETACSFMNVVVVVVFHRPKYTSHIYMYILPMKLNEMY